MATHFSILAWEIPWTEEPDGLESMESQGVKHDCTNASTQVLRWVLYNINSLTSENLHITTPLHQMTPAQSRERGSSL